MIKRIAKLGNNTHQNFKVSPDISYWSVKYNTSIDEVQKIFTESGNSISKTIEILRKKEQKV